ncbi:hypothetical protein [Desulfitobacterium hafniense]|uniref:hypothetical protein n=1 Tax=Desulfitobacterium hafniense TaxID=49338 RepID=UPI00036D1C3F|nr:hypothetical protein [Desulfitobacterium hafniense]
MSELKMKSFNSEYYDHCSELGLMPTDSGYEEWLKERPIILTAPQEMNKYKRLTKPGIAGLEAVCRKLTE